MNLLHVYWALSRVGVRGVVLKRIRSVNDNHYGYTDTKNGFHYNIVDAKMDGILVYRKPLIPTAAPEPVEDTAKEADYGT